MAAVVRGGGSAGGGIWRRQRGDVGDGRSWPKVPAGIACWNGHRRDRARRDQSQLDKSLDADGREASGAPAADVIR
jgi:hypothetical protein